MLTYECDVPTVVDAADEQFARPAPPETRGFMMPPWCEPENLVYSFSIPMETPSNNVIKGMHWHDYRHLRKVWRLKVLARGLKGRKPTEPIERAALLVIRHCAGQLDWDNALGGLKPLQDCLVTRKAKVNPDGLGLIVDDNPKNMPYPPFMQQVIAPPGKGFTEVFLYRLP
jgi:hypothetical protein